MSPEWTRGLASTTDTVLHRRLRVALGRLGFYVEDEVPVGKYRLDCYVRELHLGFEADGPLHRRAFACRGDVKRDSWIRFTAGIPVCRVSDVMLAADSVVLDAHLSGWIDKNWRSVDLRLDLGESNGVTV